MSSDTGSIQSPLIHMRMMMISAYDVCFLTFNQEPNQRLSMHIPAVGIYDSSMVYNIGGYQGVPRYNDQSMPRRNSADVRSRTITVFNSSFCVVLKETRKVQDGDRKVWPAPVPIPTKLFSSPTPRLPCSSPPSHSSNPTTLLYNLSTSRIPGWTRAHSTPPRCQSSPAGPPET